MEFVINTEHLRLYLIFLKCRYALIMTLKVYSMVVVLYQIICV